MDVAELTLRYADMLAELAPRGLYSKMAVGPNLRRMLEALAAEFALGHGRVDDLLREQYPRTSVELLADWERVLGLPDNCGTPPATLEARRAAVLAKLIGPRGNSRVALEALALNLGYPITLEEFKVFRVGSRVGDRVYGVDGGWPWAFKVHAPVVTAFFFRAGSGSAGDPISYFDNSPLECTITRIKQAQAHPIFDYDQPPAPEDWQPWGRYVIPDVLDLKVEFPPWSLEL